MANFSVILSSDPVPSTFCPISDMDWAFLVRLLHAEISGDPSINFGSSTPLPDNRGKPWFFFDDTGTNDGWYVFVNGVWRSKHSLAPGTVALFRGQQSDIDAFDGGTAGTITPISGPFWAEVTELRARFPLGPGTLPSSTVVAVTNTGGEEAHSLTDPEMPPHRHLVVSNVDQNPGPAGGGINVGGNSFIARSSNFDGAGSPFSYHLGGATPEPTLAITSKEGGTGSPKTVTPHATMPPWYGIFFIERTARQYRVKPG